MPAVAPGGSLGIYWREDPGARTEASCGDKYLVTLVLRVLQLFAFDEKFLFHGASLGRGVQTRHNRPKYKHNNNNKKSQMVCPSARELCSDTAQKWQTCPHSAAELAQAFSSSIKTRGQGSRRKQGLWQVDLVQSQGNLEPKLASGSPGLRSCPVE